MSATGNPKTAEIPSLIREEAKPTALYSEIAL
jgi:hypothetical protein